MRDRWRPRLVIPSQPSQNIGKHHCIHYSNWCICRFHSSRHAAYLCSEKGFFSDHHNTIIAPLLIGREWDGYPHRSGAKPPVLHLRCETLVPRIRKFPVVHCRSASQNIDKQLLPTRSIRSHSSSRISLQLVCDRMRLIYPVFGVHW